MNNNKLENLSRDEEIGQVLHESQLLVENLIDEVSALSTEFRMGITPELSMAFDECLSSIQTLMATMLTLQYVSRNNEKFEKIWKESYVIWEATEGLFKTSLNAMLRSYGHEDYVALAEIMEEELLESLNSWQKFVRKLDSKL